MKILILCMLVNYLLTENYSPQFPEYLFFSLIIITFSKILKQIDGYILKGKFLKMYYNNPGKILIISPSKEIRFEQNIGTI